MLSIVDANTLSVSVKMQGRASSDEPSIVRLLGTNSPSSVHGSECFGKEAKEFTERELPEGAIIFLVGDRDNRNHSGHLLRYLWKENGEFFTLKLIEMGHAKAVLFVGTARNDKYQAHIQEAEARAIAGKRGLWGACGPRGNFRPDASKQG